MNNESKPKRGAVVATQTGAVATLAGFAWMVIRSQYTIPWGVEMDVVFIGSVVGVLTGALHYVMKLLPERFRVG